MMPLAGACLHMTRRYSLRQNMTVSTLCWSLCLNLLERAFVNVLVNSLNRKADLDLHRLPKMSTDFNFQPSTNVIIQGNDGE